MRRFIIAAGLCLSLLGVAAAHEGHHHHHEAEEQAAPTTTAAVAPVAPPRSEFAMFLDHMTRPEYLHVLINPLPGAGMALGAVLLLIGLSRPKSGVTEVGLGVVLGAGVMAFPTIKLGQRAYDRIFDALTPNAQQWLDVHMARAERLQLVFYAAAVVAGWALVQARRRSSGARTWTVASLVLALACVGLAVWIAHAGGQIQHSEFREGPPPASAMQIVPTQSHHD